MLGSILVGVLFAGMWEGATQLRDINNRKDLYTQARTAADEKGKPLLVVGKPTIYGVRMHPCGDVCLDLQGCPECPSAVQGDVRNMTMFTDKQFGAVFCSHVLEHLPLDQAQIAYRELQRVADTVFIALPSPVAFWTVINPDHKWVPTGVNIDKLTRPS